MKEKTKTARNSANCSGESVPFKGKMLQKHGKALSCTNHGHSSQNIESPTSKRTLWKIDFHFAAEWKTELCLLPYWLKWVAKIIAGSIDIPCRFKNKKGLVITTSNYNRLVGGFHGPRCVFTQNMFMVHVKHLQITIMIWMTFVDYSTRLRSLFLGGWAVWEFMQCLSNRNSE